MFDHKIHSNHVISHCTLFSLSHCSHTVITITLFPQVRETRILADTNIATADTLERKLRKLEAELEKLQLEKTLVVDANVRKLNAAWYVVTLIEATGNDM